MRVEFSPPLYQHCLSLWCETNDAPAFPRLCGVARRVPRGKLAAKPTKAIARAMSGRIKMFGNTQKAAQLLRIPPSARVCILSARLPLAVLPGPGLPAGRLVIATF